MPLKYDKLVADFAKAIGQTVSQPATEKPASTSVDRIVSLALQKIDLGAQNLPKLKRMAFLERRHMDWCEHALSAGLSPDERRTAQLVAIGIWGRIGALLP
jgi:hypothetical protein